MANVAMANTMSFSALRRTNISIFLSVMEGPGTEDLDFMDRNSGICPDFLLFLIQIPFLSLVRIENVY